MFERIRDWKKPTALDELINALMEDMKTHETDSQEYKQLLKHLERLTNLKTKSRKKPVSRDAIVAGVASVMGILVIVMYENKHVMSSKGLNFVPKP